MKRLTLLTLALSLLPGGTDASHADLPPRLSYDLTEATISHLLAAQRAGRLTASEIWNWHLARIKAYDRAGPRLQSMRHVNTGAADVAAELDAHVQPRGPLHGIPIAIKDNIDVAGWPTSAGSLALGDAVPAHDATLVQRLRAAGAILTGKSAMTELAAFMSTGIPAGFSADGGFVCNPYAPRRDLTVDGSCVLTPGGSSSGAAVAVAAGMSVAAVGTETSGSILRPASMNQIVGVRPTVGLVSRHGVVPVSLDRDSPGPLARNVADAATILGVIAGYDPLDRATEACRVAGRCFSDYRRFLDRTSLRGARIVVPLLPYWQRLGADEQLRLAEAIAVMRGRGAEVIRTSQVPSQSALASRAPCVAFPFDADCSSVLLYSFKRDLNAYLAKRGPSARIQTLAQLVTWNRNHLSAIPYGQAIAAAAENLDTSPESADSHRYHADLRIDATACKGTLDELLAGADGRTGTADDADAILFPAGEGARITAGAGYPSVAVPAGRVSHPAAGLAPFGIALSGKAFSEPRLLALAYAFEQATLHRRPPASTPPLDRGRARLP